MNNYELQSYFEKLCDIYYTAQTNAKRATEKINKEENSIEAERDEKFWTSSAWNQFVEITSHIAQMRKEKYKIIITTKQEVFTLIRYCDEKYPAAYDLINRESNHLIDFPKDEMSKEFMKAYVEKDESKMRELHKKYF